MPASGHAHWTTLRVSLGADSPSGALRLMLTITSRLRRAAREELVGEIASQRLRALDVVHFGVALAAQDRFSARARDQSTQPQRALLPLGVRRERRRRIAAQDARERALRRRRQRRRAIRERGQRGNELGPVAAALDRERPLSRRRQAFVGLEQRADARSVARALERGHRHDERIATPAVERAQPRVHVAAQRLDDEPGTTLTQLRMAAKARRADDRALGHGIERAEALRHERVARVLARSDACNGEARRDVARQVLERVHGDVGAPFRDGRFEVLDHRRSLAAGRARAVAGRPGHAQDVQRHAGVERRQALAHLLGLPHGRRDVSSCNGEAARRGHYITGRKRSASY